MTLSHKADALPGVDELFRMPYDGPDVPHVVIEVNQKCNISCKACYKDKLDYTPSHIVRRIVGNYPGLCKFCKDYKATRSDVKLHEKKCTMNPQREMKIVLEEEVKTIEAEI